MCGIIGFTGGREAAPVLLEGLKALEYRGYDLSLIHISPPPSSTAASTAGTSP